MSAPQLLAGLTVLDLSNRLGAPVADMLENFGAERARIEGAPTAEHLAAADFLVESFYPAHAAELGLTPDRTAAANPRLIHVSVTPFGPEAPYRDWRGGELVTSALSGTLRTVGYEDRAPVKEALDACIFHAGCAAFSGAMLAHYERGVSGLGQHVDVSVHEVAFSRNTNNILTWQFDRRKLERSGYKLRYGIAAVRCIWELSDGYCFHTLMSGRLGAPANAALSAWMDEVGARNPLQGVDWMAYNRSTLSADTRADWEDAIDAFFRTRNKAEVRERNAALGLNATVAQDADDILADPHLRARGFWRELALEDGKLVELPAYFVSEGRAA